MIEKLNIKEIQNVEELTEKNKELKPETENLDDNKKLEDSNSQFHFENK